MPGANRFDLMKLIHFPVLERRPFLAQVAVMPPALVPRPQPAPWGTLVLLPHAPWHPWC